MERLIRWALAAAIASCAAFFSTPGTAYALGCNGHLVEVGDNIAYVQSVCGQPTSVSSHQETRGVYGGYASRYGVYYGSTASTTVQVDVLFYDFGPTRFMEELTFENGVLRGERVAGYGTVAGARARRESMRGPRTAYVREDD